MIHLNGVESKAEFKLKKDEEREELEKTNNNTLIIAIKVDLIDRLLTAMSNGISQKILDFDKVSLSR